jgi:hypothetical protein
MNNPSDPADASPPAPQSASPAGDNAWLSSLLYGEGSSLIEYGDGILLIDESPPYGKSGQG